MADTTTTSTGPAATIDGLVGKATGWVDKLFEFFGVYTAKYSKYLVYGLIIFLLGKMLKIKFNIDTSRKGK
jgi:hypothetical protein